MILPNAQRAVIDDAKIYAYCLSDIHIEGQHKAHVFKAVLGFTAENGEELKSLIWKAILAEDAVFEKTLNFGAIWRVDFLCRRNRREATICSIWIIRNGEDFPRLVSCYIL
jgi:hypothetical protein